MATSGVLIIADYVSRDSYGRYTIVNTFNIIGRAYKPPWPPPEDVSRRLFLYGRFLPERQGEHQIDVVFKNDNQECFGHEELRVQLVQSVDNVLCQAEFMIEVPELRFKHQIARKIDDQNYEIKATLELHVDGDLLASTPLWVKYAEASAGQFG